MHDKTLQQIKSVLKELDKPLRRLMITVRYASESQQSENSTAISGNLELSKQDKEKMQSNARITARVTRTKSDEDIYSTQQIQAIEGQWAGIDIGQLTPVNKTDTHVSGLSTTIQTKTEYKKTGAGFSVLPILRNDHVLLKIAPYLFQSEYVRQSKKQTA